MNEKLSKGREVYMNTYFNLKLEFNHFLIHKEINECIESDNTGYICVVDANVLTIAQKNPSYRQIINNSLVNTCDGSSIAFFAGLIHNEKFKALTGPELFSKYIELPYKQILLGSTIEIVEKIKQKIVSNGFDSRNIFHIPVPFLQVEDFDYLEIANLINKFKPDIIWVSLGAPKQEIFMSNILSFIEKGLMFGIGAAFNFYIGEITSPRKRNGTFQFIWLYRIFHEPKKQLKRIIPYISILPMILYKEIKLINKYRK